MTEMTVRKPAFDFPTELAVMPDLKDKYYAAFTSAVTFIAPNIERYLIRMMSRAKAEIKDPQVLDDLLTFSQQEAAHTKGHEQLNEILLARMSEKGRERVKAINDQMAEDYRRFLNTRSLNFNLAYGEGFESVTCAIGLWAFQHRTFEGLTDGWRELIEWHLAEEVEHRTVAYDVYHGFKGHWLHRITFSTYAQLHLLKYIVRFGRCFMEEYDFPGDEKSVFKQYFWSLLRHYLKTVPPWYSPRKLKIDPAINRLLEKFS
ncbi:metal-dependent hydrolase [Parendozoicomonas haliclonae]|uniref:Putative metal-dependent hydrolase n=1 Tax=Parendozoicomonas haliclonae TaxID=1960125 RepID=A0A1X7ALQ2_9GAMM|nr:metal-dependent hydrolase [Parendozoicomonas haliclonae]SMA49038.1 putative metal-dependent hydrolase [Parendozoicomonas haliclonae]